MRIAVLSDIHGNRHAFEAVLAAVAGESVDSVWCLGDVVGYGADPDVCSELAARECDVCLVGNHDLAVRGDIPLDEFSTGARVAAEWTQEVIAPANLEFLRTLSPELLDREDVGLFHASPRDPVWEYVLSTLLADMCLDTQRHRVCLIGHSHVALSFRREEGEPATGETRRDGDEVDLTEHEWLLNPGSVGQPRDGDPRAAWLVLDTNAPSATWRRTSYDVAGAAAAIRAARLPDSLAERLEYGQ
ncbi:MAG TPA: metallophosphoesterase family protein [Solirubrobacteraceae bacterium]|nr:metallophosphoesterase family protein [Solirubrobacteraceae bacterium]